MDEPRHGVTRPDPNRLPRAVVAAVAVPPAAFLAVFYLWPFANLVVTAVDGTDIPLRADSICVHGDGEKALLFVRRIRAALEAKGVALRAL